MSSLNFFDLLIVFLFVAVSYFLINVLKIGLSQWLKWDIGEKEKALQQKLIELQYECDKYKEEVTDLRKQIKILLGQYDEAVIKLNRLQGEYRTTSETAEGLRRELERMQADLLQETPDTPRNNRVLIVAVGSTRPSVNLDMASLRAVEAETGMMVQRIPDATPDKLKMAIDKARRRRDIIYLHMAVDSDENGFHLMDQVVDSDWMATNLGSVVVLVIAAQDKADVAEFLGIIPYVVSMSDKVISRDAAIFSREFWTEIGRGIGPTMALKRALSHSPSAMKTYVTPNWDMSGGY